MTYRDKLLAEMHGHIQEIGRIADGYEAMANETREFIEKISKPSVRPLTRPEARALYNYCPPIELKSVK